LAGALSFGLAAPNGGRFNLRAACAREIDLE
jgi:hypothetical protein